MNVYQEGFDKGNILHCMAESAELLARLTEAELKVLRLLSDGLKDEENNTDVQPTLVSSGQEITYFSADYGNTGWLGAASVWSGTTLCGNQFGITGNCNKTTVKADKATLHLNDYYFDPWNGNYAASFERRRTAGHELGHVFGLSHAPEAWEELMSPSGFCTLMSRRQMI